MVVVSVMHRLHSLSFLWAIWDGLRQTRSGSARGEDGAVPPTGNPGLRHWLDCAAVAIALLDPAAEHGPAAARSNSNTFDPAALGRGARASYNMTSENKHKRCNWQRCNGKERERGGRQEAIGLADGSRGLGAFSHRLLQHRALLPQHLPPMGTGPLRPDQLLPLIQALPWLGGQGGRSPTYLNLSSGVPSAKPQPWLPP